METSRLLVGAVLVCALWGGRVTGVAQQQTPSGTVPDLSSGWLLMDVSGSGSFGGMVGNYPPPELTAAGQAIVVRSDGRNLVPADGGSAPAHEAGEAYIVNTGGCTPEGTGGSGIDHNSTAFFLLQSKDEVLLVREGPGGRRFYMDGRGLRDPATFTPSRYGYSVGRYEGNALVVDTVGLSTGNVFGGGRRRPETRLTERFELLPDGQHLTITYTWDDPTVYVRPYTYQRVFERLPADSYALETWCDSSDPLQQQSIVPPEQAQ